MFVDIEIEVDSNLTVEEGHEIAELVRNRIFKANEYIGEVLVHIEPAKLLVETSTKEAYQLCEKPEQNQTL